MLDFDTYKEFAMRTNGTKTPEGMIRNAALGLAGESGEIADHIKKVDYHGHPLDAQYIAKELGDILWYCAQMCEAFGWDMSDVANANVQKLHNRYPEGFSSERSINRNA